MTRPPVRDGIECPDCGLPVRPDAEHDCDAVPEEERAYDRWETLRGGST